MRTNVTEPLQRKISKPGEASESLGGRYESLTWVNVFLLLPVTISFWLFSRLTVDDAFISWRYGKNLIKAGVWNYNPVSFDLTQAYSNAIYAFLSIVPNMFGIDVVLFFKITALLILIFFILWLKKKTSPNSLTMLLLFMALPATFIHLFAGLETFLFVAFVTALLINLYEYRLTHSIILGVLLLLTRPEAWLLTVLIPLFFLLSPLDKKIDRIDYVSVKNDIKGTRLNWKQFYISLLILSISLSGLFLFNYYCFNSVLPNSFNNKVTGAFSVQKLAWFLFFASPVIGLLYLRKTSLFIFSILFFGSMAMLYSASSLWMNYAERFAYHIFAPVFLFGVFLASENKNSVCCYISKHPTFNTFSEIHTPTIINSILLVVFAVFSVQTIAVESLAGYSNNYPRLLAAQAALGKTLKSIAIERGLTSFSFGDAGAVAYQSEIIALDNIGLGSAYVAREGMDFKILNEYSPDFVIFHSYPSGIRLQHYNQQIIYDWSIDHDLVFVCDVYKTPSNRLRVYSKSKYPALVDLCEASKELNDMWDNRYFMRFGFIAPWKFWHE